MLANIRQIEFLQENFGHFEVSNPDISVFNPELYQVENAPLDLSSNQDGTITPGVVKPVAPVTPVTDGAPLPQWGSNLTGRVKNLEGRLGNVEGRLSNVEGRLSNVEKTLSNVQRDMATKADLNAMKEELKTLIQQR